MVITLSRWDLYEKSDAFYSSRVCVVKQEGLVSLKVSQSDLEANMLRFYFRVSIICIF